MTIAESRRKRKRLEVIPVFSNRVKRLREYNHLSKKELAKKLGVTPSLISQYEEGHNLPQAMVLLDLAGLLGVDLGYLLGEDIYTEGTYIDKDQLAPPQPLFLT